ncbi:hypothetical protein OG244_06725 [Streptomyces brevispora]|uniref:hypothetical protein n=1 Tax=Streptomyces brevispora TaxID=887462 RepID=UPI002E31D261|nr:hypothetical protein [Streptomyces brevispora]
MVTTITAFSPDVNACPPNKSAGANSTTANRRSTAHRAIASRPNDPSTMRGTLSTTTTRPTAAPPERCHAGRVGPT